jgi:hypothetical protein
VALEGYVYFSYRKAFCLYMYDSVEKTEKVVTQSHKQSELYVKRRSFVFQPLYKTRVYFTVSCSQQHGMLEGSFRLL